MFCNLLCVICLNHLESTRLAARQHEMPVHLHQGLSVQVDVDVTQPSQGVMNLSNLNAATN